MKEDGPDNTKIMEFIMDKTQEMYEIQISQTQIDYEDQINELREMLAEKDKKLDQQEY